MTSPASATAADVPTQVFEKALEELAVAGLPEELVTRLRKTLLEDRAFTENALKKAVFGEEPPP
jgi:hypothetical protein